MGFVHEYNKNDRYVNMHDKFAWQSKLLSNWLWFIGLFVVRNEMTKTWSNFYSSNGSANQQNPALRKELKLCHLHNILFYAKVLIDL